MGWLAGLILHEGAISAHDTADQVGNLEQSVTSDALLCVPPTPINVDR